MKTVQGDLLELALAGEFDVIVHGCNCFCTMGRGIAAQIRKTFPEAYAADCETVEGSRDKLGHLSEATVERDGHEITIVNGYTQHDWRGEGVLVDYPAVREVFRAVAARHTGKRIGYPKIGAGLARGDWDRIAEIIDDELAGEDHTLVEYVPG